MTNFASYVKDFRTEPGPSHVHVLPEGLRVHQRPFDDVVKPAHVRLLDYEIEIGLVLGETVPVGTVITDENVADVVAGLVIVSDVSRVTSNCRKPSSTRPSPIPHSPLAALARPARRGDFTFHRPFAWSCGSAARSARHDDRAGRSTVPRRHGLSTFQRLDAGDLVLTGTPGGTALTARQAHRDDRPSLPPALKWKSFFRAQARNPKYLKDGDLLELSAATGDGTLDLGIQRTKVRYS